MTLLALLLPAALASVDPACEDVAKGGPPDDYSEQNQADFLLNYFALATTFSPLHAPVPLEPGHASVGIELAGIPPLGCERRLVLSYSKTEETNKAPAAPRPRVLVTMPALGKIVPYAGLGYVPPVTVFGTRNVIVSGEVGAGVPLDSGLQLGGRYHFTLMKTVADVASAYVEGDPVYLDLYSGSTYGVDLMGGWEMGKITPYLALGFTDVSTFFWIGDDGFVGNNCTPYDGPTASVGAQGTFNHIDVAAEFYTAPKNIGKVQDDASCASVNDSAPSHIYTGRLRVAYAF